MPVYPYMPTAAHFPVTGDISSIGVRSAFIVAALPFVGTTVPTVIADYPNMLGAGWRRHYFRRWRRWGRWRRLNNDGLRGWRSRLDIGGAARR
jgi:hypothetical protein